MADERMKRGTSKHRGVCIYSRVLPSGNTVWRAVYVDPDTRPDPKTGKIRKTHEAIPDGDRETEPQRLEWAIRKANEIRERAEAIKKGAAIKKGCTVDDVMRRFLDDNRTLRPKTLRGYSDAAAALVEWTRSQRIELADDLRGEHLTAFRSFLINKPRRAPMRKGKRYAQEETKRTRSAHTVNRELRAVKTALDYVRRLGLVPMLTSDMIRDHLLNMDKEAPVPTPFKKTVLAKILEATKRHDEKTWELTRREKEAGLKKGSTPRFTQIGSYFAFLVLSGMREGEARNLRWERVDLDAEQGGEIVLTKEDTKTKRGRTLDLSVSPLLREWIETQRLKAPADAVYVFGDAKNEHDETVPALTREAVEAGRRRAISDYGAPKVFTWQRCRQTCGSYLCNSPGIFPTSIAAFRESRQLGHSIEIAQRCYVDVIKGIDPNAKTLEAALGSEEKLREALGFVVAKEQERAASSS